MISEHIMAPASPADERHGQRTRGVLLVYIAAAVALYLWAINALRRLREDRQDEIDRDFDDETRRQVDAVGRAELVAYVDAIASYRGRCTCAEPKACGAPRCILCHGCHKVVAIVKRPAAWSPDSPERAALLQRHRDAIAANRPFDGGAP